MRKASLSLQVLFLFVALTCLPWQSVSFPLTSAQIKIVKPKPTPKRKRHPKRRPKSVSRTKSAPILTSSPAPTPAWLLRTVSFETVRLADNGRVLARAPKQVRSYVEDLGNDVTLEMVEVPGDTFMMGSPGAEKDRGDDEGPQHRVTVPTFFMGRFEVTQAQWRAVMGGDPSSFKGDKLPVESVSWNDAKEFCAQLSKKTGRAYRLPSEAEWEYAARAGTTTPFAFGETITPQFVNYDGKYPYASAPKGEYRQKTVPVGSLGVANAFGLYDLHGNVWEWCEDAWHDNYNGAPTDGRAWTSGGDQNRRVLRGGSWDFRGGLCRSACRSVIAPGDRDYDNGFRVVVSARTQ